MANTDFDNIRPEPGPADGEGGSPPPSPTGPGGDAPPPAMGGGPVLAALARRQGAPNPSAQGPGNQAQGLMMLKTGVEMIQQALPHLDTGSPPYRDAVRALTTLSRHLPQGAPVAGVQQTQLMDLLRNTVRNSIMQKIMSQKGGGGGPQQAGPPGGPPGGAPAPSTPLPGA